MIERRDAMVAMIRLAKVRCSSPPTTSTTSPREADDKESNARELRFKRVTERSAAIGRDDIILSLKRSFDKVQRSPAAPEPAVGVATGGVSLLPQLCSVVGQARMHSHAELHRAKSPMRVLTSVRSNRILGRARAKELAPLPPSTAVVESVEHINEVVPLVESCGSPLRRRREQQEHERILKDAGYTTANDFDNDDERQLAVAHAKKIVNRRALHRSLHHRRPVSVESQVVDTVHSGNMPTPRKGARIGDVGQRAPPPPPPPFSSCGSTTTETIFASVIGRSQTGVTGKRKDTATIGGAAVRTGTLSPIPMPNSELVKRTVPMLDGIDSLSLTTRSGNCFRLSSDVEFSLKNSLQRH